MTKRGRDAPSSRHTPSGAQAGRERGVVCTRAGTDREAVGEDAAPRRSAAS